MLTFLSFINLCEKLLSFPTLLINYFLLDKIYTERFNYMADLLYQGHGSFRLEAKDGVVIYVDPFAGTGYDLPADIILITHQHGDHNQISLINQKHNCKVITNHEAINSDKYNSFEIGKIKIEAVEAYNKNHNKSSCVGYIISIDDVVIYASGDTSMTNKMKELSERHLDYALLPCDGYYNMDPIEASKCAELIAARHSIPIHLKPGEIFDRSQAEMFNVAGRIILEPTQTLELKHE